MRPGPSTDHDPPKRRQLDEDGRDTRPHAKVKPLPGDHPERRWRPEHLAAGYHLQPWEPARPDHQALGLYLGQEGLLEVRYLEHGHTEAPEYEIEWENGPTITVLDHLVVEDYLTLHNAKRTRQRKHLSRWAAYKDA